MRKLSLGLTQAWPVLQVWHCILRLKYAIHTEVNVLSLGARAPWSVHGHHLSVAFLLGLGVQEYEVGADKADVCVSTMI